MAKILLCNWAHRETSGAIGGCETVFDDLANTLRVEHEVKLVDYSVAAKSLGIGVPYGQLGFPEVEASYVIDKYLHDYFNIFGAEDTMLITNAGASNCWFEHPCKSVAFFNDPYVSLWREMANNGFLNPIVANRYAGVCSTLQKRTAENSTKCVAPSRFMAQNDMRELGVGADEIFPNGVSLDEFFRKPAPKEKYGVPADRKIVVWSGSSHPLKWHLIPGIVKSLPEVFFVLVFKNPVDYRPRLPNVRILSCVPRGQMNEVYNLGDVFLLPSMVENCNLSIFEAMGCVLPVVISKTGYFFDREGVTDFGFVVKTPTVENFERAIRESFLKGYIFKGREHIRINQLDIESWRGRWKVFIDRVLNKE